MYYYYFSSKKKHNKSCFTFFPVYIRAAYIIAKTGHVDTKLPVGPEGID